MAEKSAYSLIKRQNGERFARAIRTYDAEIFDIPNIVDIVRYAGRDARPLLMALHSMKADVKAIDAAVETPQISKDPFELLASVGYRAEYADTLEKQNAIRKYFYQGEELCTFRDSGRFQQYYILNLVHRDADKLKRASFKEPHREDLYGTSVMSIQIGRNYDFISIKNRYNHSVDSPDNTYNSNPDNIVPGLTVALREYFNCDFSVAKTNLPYGYVYANGNIYKYDVELDGVYYGSGFCLYNGVVRTVDKCNEIMMDTSIFGLSGANRGPVMVDPMVREYDSFASVFADAVAGKKIHISKTAAGATRIASDKDTWVDVADSHVVGVSLPNVTRVPDDFLAQAQHIKYLNMPDLQHAGNRFCIRADDMWYLNVPRLKTVGEYCFAHIGALVKLDLPALEHAGNFFCRECNNLREINAPRLRALATGAFNSADKIETVYLPNVQTIGDSVFCNARCLKSLILPKVRAIGDDCFDNATRVARMRIPNVRTIGNGFMRDNEKLKDWYVPKLESVGSVVLAENNILDNIFAPKLTRVGYKFLCHNMGLRDFVAPNLSSIGSEFLFWNDALKNIYTPKLDASCFFKSYDSAGINVCELAAARYIYAMRGIKIGYYNRNRDNMDISAIKDRFVRERWAQCINDYGY